MEQPCIDPVPRCNKTAFPSPNRNSEQVEILSELGELGPYHVDEEPCVNWDDERGTWTQFALQLLDHPEMPSEMSAVGARVSTGDQPGTSGVGQVGRGPPLPDSGTSDSDLDSMIGRYIRLNFQMPYLSVLIASYVCFN